MGDDTAVHHGLFSKHRWRGKSHHDEAPAKKPILSPNNDDDVNDFLKPSVEKSQAIAAREHAAQAFLAAANKPRIDVAKAQRWPDAHDVIGSGRDRSPLPMGGLKKGRKKGLTVSFARTQPEIIGHGGDETEEPSIEVSMRKKSNSVSDMDNLRARNHQDDMNIGWRSPKFNNGLQSPVERSQRHAELAKQERSGLTRSLTSHGEMSPPLRQKMNMGSINTHASPPPPAPPQRLGPMGLGDRPRQLQRAPTGFDVQEESAGRPSMDSTYSYESEMSPHPSRQPQSLPPTQEEEEDFVPKPLKRSQTGWSEHQGDSDDELPPPPPVRHPTLPEMEFEGNSPIDLNKNFLQSEPTDPSSFSARVAHRMRADEGRALHEAANNGKRDSGSSGSLQAGSPPPSYAVAPAAAYGSTPPTSYAKPLPSPGRTPPRPLSERAMHHQNLEAELDPHRSRARGPSPNRPPISGPHNPALALDTEMRPGSAGSSQYTMPSAASRSVTSDPFSAATQTSIQPTPPSYEREGSRLVSNSSIQKTPPKYERPTYPTTGDARIDPPGAKPPPPPPHGTIPNPGAQAAPALKKETMTQAVPPLARSDTRAQGEAALTDFADRVSNMQGIFRLTAELGGQAHDRSPMQWLRVAIWWFLRGRAAMENLIRSRPKVADPGAQPQRLEQPHVDLAKVWWILDEIIPNHPSLRKFGDGRMGLQSKLAREAGDVAMAEVYEAYDVVNSYLKMLLGSMKRHHAMPPTQALIQGQDQNIWVEYPRFAPDVTSALSSNAARMVMERTEQEISPATIIPLGDTKTDFCYMRMFVNVSLSTDDAESDRVSMPAVLSVLRPRDSLPVKLNICSMTNLINVFVQNDERVGPTWRDVKWKVKTRGLYVRLRHGYDMNVEFSEQDYRSLFAIVDHTNRVESQIREREDERQVFRLTLRDFSYKDPTNPQAFPAERVKACKCIIYERCERSNEGSGKRRLHRGYRLIVITNTKNRTLSCVTHEFGKTEPLNFEFAADSSEGNPPALIVRAKEDMQSPGGKPKVCTLYMVFNENKERNDFFGCLTSANMSEAENAFARVPLKSMSIENADPAEGFSHSGTNVMKKLGWQELKVINQDPDVAGLESAPMVMSEYLRIVARHGFGNLTDRMNLGPAELIVRLPTNGASELIVLRNPQQDLAVSVDNSRADRDVPDALAELLRTVTTASTLRTYTFHDQGALHAFQMAATGFYVLFDGLAASFNISRRRMVVPIYKTWTAHTVRLQVVQQENIVQLLAFFEDFSHADAMNFQLKSMDVFEKIEKSGKPCVRLVDAKFALPVEERKGEGKMGKEEGKLTGWAGIKRKFVCLDQIEYPGEHDDIVIGFDSAEVRDKFAAALPAATQVERKITLRRKI